MAEINPPTREQAYIVIREEYDNVIKILKDEFYNEPIYNLSIYKKIFIDLNSCLVKTEVKAKTEEEIDKLFNAKRKKLEEDYKIYYNNDAAIIIDKNYIEKHILTSDKFKYAQSELLYIDDKIKYIDELIAEEKKKQQLAKEKLDYHKKNFKENIRLKDDYEGKEKINYKKLKTIYFVLFTLYKELYDKIIDFKKRYFEPSTNTLRKLDEKNETSLINEQKTKADEIIEYNILFKFMNNFLLLSKFIHNFENYYNSFATDRKSLKIIFRAFINTSFNIEIKANFNNNNAKYNYVKYIVLLYYYINKKLKKIYNYEAFNLDDIIDLKSLNYENDIKTTNNKEDIKGLQITYDGMKLDIGSSSTIKDYLAIYNNNDDKIKEIKEVPEIKITLEEIFMETDFQTFMDKFRSYINDARQRKAVFRTVGNYFKLFANSPVGKGISTVGKGIGYLASKASTLITYPAQKIYDNIPETRKDIDELYKKSFNIILFNIEAYNDINRIIKKLVDIENIYNNIILKLGTDIKTNINHVDLVNIKPDNVILGILDRNGLKKTLTGALDKLENGKPINVKELRDFNNLEDSINQIENEDERKKALAYIYQVKEKLNKHNKNFKDEDIIDTTKIILNFTKVAKIFRQVILGLTMICIVIYLVVLLISIYNFFNLIIRIITSIIYLFYNKTVINNNTLSYSTQGIINCTKDNYTDDIFNVLNEQLTALSVFNTNIYIIYVLLAYIIIYILHFVYASMFPKTHYLHGDIKDIDPRFTLLTIIGLIFMCSFIHLLIYKFLFKSICVSKFKELASSETNIDNLIKNEITKKNKIEIETFNKFYKLLEDISNRNEVDTFLNNMVLELQDAENSDLGKYLLIYDVYIYFEEYIYMDDINKILIKKYFDEIIKGNNRLTNTFIAFLDTNERRLIKPYHEELPFYNQIPNQKLENFKIINENIGDILKNINKSIIKYSGTFYPFLFTSIYIILIFIYNLMCIYVIFAFIADTKEENIFFDAIYKLADKILYYYKMIYNIINR